MTRRHSSTAGETFVLTACGDPHVAHANQALAFLKRYCRQEIVVVTARSSAGVDHDQVVRRTCPPELTDVQVSRYLKTGLYEILAPIDGKLCYLDNDVVAVSEEAGHVFEHHVGPVSFALDQSGRISVEHFSPWAVREGSLTEAIREKLGVVVDPRWRLWNGGLFIFDKGARDLMTTWHEYTVASFDDPRWHTRDQGTLVAAVWKHGLENHPTLPDVFNWMPRHSPGDLDFSKHRFVHFIHGYGDASWPEWNRVRALLP